MSADGYNLGQILAGKLTLAHVTELVRQFQLRNGLLADGMCGPATLGRLDELMVVEAAPATWDKWLGPMGTALPKTPASYYKTYGNPGAGAWYADSIIELHQSRGNELPMVPSWQYVMCHRKVEPYAREGLRRAQMACPNYTIERFGSYNYRPQQHDTRRPLSKHAFGAAFDVNAHKNRAVRFASKADKPEPWSEEWYAIWPDGLPAAFVDAMESVGFRWGGWWTDPCDPMHLEL